jgi:predicted negative regulator of RcsB-dependent stress response
MRLPAEFGRRIFALAWVCLAITLAPSQPALGQDPAEDLLFSSGQEAAFAEALSQLRDGGYDEALAALQDLAGNRNAGPVVKRAYARALMEVGRYDDALRAMEGRRDSALSGELENVLGEIYYLRGRIGEAEAAFRRALEAGASDRHVARLNLGIRRLWASSTPSSISTTGHGVT